MAKTSPQRKKKCPKMFLQRMKTKKKMIVITVMTQKKKMK